MVGALIPPGSSHASDTGSVLPIDARLRRREPTGAPPRPSHGVRSPARAIGSLRLPARQEAASPTGRPKDARERRSRIAAG